jgi:hypothetical protein
MELTRPRLHVMSNTFLVQPPLTGKCKEEEPSRREVATVSVNAAPRTTTLDEAFEALADLDPNTPQLDKFPGTSFSCEPGTP